MSRVRRSPEQRYEAAVQRVEKALLSLGNIQGEFDPGVIQATGTVLEDRLKAALGRIRPTTQLTIFSRLERLAEMSTARILEKIDESMETAPEDAGTGDDDAD